MFEFESSYLSNVFLDYGNLINEIDTYSSWYP